MTIYYKLLIASEVSYKNKGNNNKDDDDDVAH